MPLLRILVVLTVGFLAQIASAAEGTPVERQWRVNGQSREALIYVPQTSRRSGTDGLPLVFVFHGHGGSSASAARQFRVHNLWPEAIVVYMQGVPTPGEILDPEGKKTGWQGRAGDFGDRDLQFFDAVLRSMRKDYPVDDARIFATGHSNGGVFTYLLWAERGDAFAAVAPSAAFIPRDILPKLTPKAVMHAGGRRDDLVKFAWQQEAIRHLIKLNDCAPGGEKLTPLITRYQPKDPSTPVLTYIHEGGHRLPPDEPAAIVQFFRTRAREEVQARQ